LRVKAAAAFAALLLVACSGSGSTTASSSRTSSPSTGSGLAFTKASDLRTRLDLLFGEQVLMVAKETAAAAYGTDEYPGYVALLATNANDLEDVMRSAVGNTAAGEFAQAWSEQNRDLIEYAVGLVTHKQSQADSAAADLNGVFVPAFGRLISSLTQLPADQMSHMIALQLTAIEAVIADAVAQTFPQMYTDLHSAYAQTSKLGDQLAGRIVQLFPDKFPGDPSLHVVDLRASVNTLLQEHAYITTMATDSVVRGRTSETPAVAAALAGSTTSLGTDFAELLGSATGKRVEQLWSLRDSKVLDYAGAAGTTTKESLVQSFAPQFASLARVAQTSAVDELSATITVIDEQKSKTFASLAADDRAAAAAMEPIADAIVAAGSAQG